MKISIIGSGVYAKSLAKVLLESKCDITMWTEQEDTSNILVPKEIKVTNSYGEAVKDTDIIYVLTSSQFCKSIFTSIKPFYDGQLFVLGSKGILKDGSLITDLLESIIPESHYAVISGPTFAVDIAALEPVGFTIGTQYREDFDIIKKSLSAVYVEYSNDVTAIEMSGSLKNAYAIGSGILECFNYGNSTRCLYITKALKEIASIFKELDLDPSSVLTLAGVGDLVLTCTSPNSRNYTFGTCFSLEAPTKKQEYLKTHTVEGYENLKVYRELFKTKKIQAPILEMVYNIVNSNIDPQNLIKLLLQ